MHSKLKKQGTKIINWFLKVPTAAKVVVFAVIAVSLLSVTFAGPPFMSREAEDGSVSGNVSSISDISASGGEAVRFGTLVDDPQTCEGPRITMNVCINSASIPQSDPASNSPLLYRDTNLLSIPHLDSDFAAFRAECGFSNIAKSDPIVYPGQSNVGHWHIFFGNTAMNETMTNARTQGSSTCAGGSINKTGYWAPLLIDTNSWDPATKTFRMAQPLQGEYVNAMQVYYKSGYRGVEASTIRPYPQGLKMIAGGIPGSNITGPPASDPNGNRNVTFECVHTNYPATNNFVNNIQGRTSLPTDCPPGQTIQASIVFPQCGAANNDGSPVLDSDDHRSHMAYPLGWPNRGCPESHPIPYPEIIEHFRWLVPPGGAGGLRFVTDTYDPSLPGGWSFHADWWNGWDADALQGIIDTCYQPSHDAYPNRDGLTPIGGRGWDCGMGIIGPHPQGGWRHLDTPR